MHRRRARAQGGIATGAPAFGGKMDYASMPAN
jgi:hypothetical protein